MSRIVQVANFYTPTSGGLRVAVHALAEGYRARGHSVHLVVPGERSRRLVDRTEIRSPRLPRSGGYRMIVSGRAVQAALDRLRPDLIEVHDKLVLRWVSAWASGRGIPVVTASHERFDRTFGDLLPILPIGLRDRLARRLVDGVLRRSDAVVAYSRFAAAEFPPSSKIRISTLGVDLHTFRPTPRGPGRGSIDLVCVSRLSPEKRADLAIDAVVALLDQGRRTELTIFGSGPGEQALRERADGLPVVFAGFVAPGGLASALACADVVLAPGPSETFGLAALEGLACGTPVVAVRGSGAAERLLDHPDAGRAVDPDGVAIAAAVASLLELPETRRRLAARTVAEGFGWGRAVDSMLDIHAELLPSSGRPDRSGHPEITDEQRVPMAQRHRFVESQTLPVRQLGP